MVHWHWQIFAPATGLHTPGTGQVPPHCPVAGFGAPPHVVGGGKQPQVCVPLTVCTVQMFPGMVQVPPQVPAASN